MTAVSWEYEVLGLHFCIMSCGEQLRSSSFLPDSFQKTWKLCGNQYTMISTWSQSGIHGNWTPVNVAVSKHYATVIYILKNTF